MNTASPALHTESIDAIPTAPSVVKATVVAVGACLAGGIGLAAWWLLPRGLGAVLAANPGISGLFSKNFVAVLAGGYFLAAGVAGAACVAAGLVALVRTRATWWLLFLTLFTVHAVGAAFVILAWYATAAIRAAGLPIDGLDQDKVTLTLLWWQLAWPALAMMAAAAWMQTMLRSRSVYAAFTREEGDPLRGDEVLEDLRTGGRDSRHRKSLYASGLTHLMVIVVIPWLMQLDGCIEPYRVPKGSGNPVVAMVKMVKPKKKKKKSITVNPNSAIVFDKPDLDHTEADEEMKEMTELKYEVASTTGATGNLGKGGGTEGGWPEGMEDYKIRFIRLEHGGIGWDDGMRENGADINFLREFARVTGFRKIARSGESHSIAMLRKYPRDAFPPFVFLTGDGAMGRVSPADAKILREYCLGGGFLIADAGSLEFHNSFVHFMRQQVFPDKPLIDVADDDELYRLPFMFPDGAPAFWHHGGRRGLGIKHEGRWVVFYHPGDMNDAWRSPGYIEVSPEMRASAMHLGINLVRYAFDRWNDAVAKARK